MHREGAHRRWIPDYLLRSQLVKVQRQTLKWTQPTGLRWWTPRLDPAVSSVLSMPVLQLNGRGGVLRRKLSSLSSSLSLRIGTHFWSCSTLLAGWLGKLIPRCICLEAVECYRFLACRTLLKKK